MNYRQSLLGRIQAENASLPQKAEEVYKTHLVLYFGAVSTSGP